MHLTFGGLPAGLFPKLPDGRMDECSEPNNRVRHGVGRMRRWRVPCDRKPPQSAYRLRHRARRFGLDGLASLMYERREIRECALHSCG